MDPSLYTLVGAGVGVLFGYIFGMLHTLSKVMDARAEVQDVRRLNQKLVDSLPTASEWAVIVAESDADEPEEPPAGPTPKTRTKVGRDDDRAPEAD